MKRFTDAGRKALKDENLYAALSLALTLPDICASLEDPGPGKSKARYIRWCTQWAEPKFTPVLRPGMPSSTLLTAEDCYNLRNSLIHSGSSEIEAAKGLKLQKVEFFDTTITSHMNRFDNVLQLRADRFSDTLFEAADEWDSAMQSNEAVQAEKAKLLVIRTRGDSIIGGLAHFGG